MTIMKGVVASCLIINLALAVCAAERPPSASSKYLASLEAELESGQLDHPRVLSGILHELGLHLMGDVRLLNAPERLELSELLRVLTIVRVEHLFLSTFGELPWFRPHGILISVIILNRSR